MVQAGRKAGVRHNAGMEGRQARRRKGGVLAARQKARQAAVAGVQWQAWWQQRAVAGGVRAVSEVSLLSEGSRGEKPWMED